jgi:maltose alpha-D-glucosyltransferase/alpha-amylase
MPVANGSSNGRTSATGIALKAESVPRGKIEDGNSFSDDSLPSLAYEVMSTYLPAVALLGKRTAEMHLALSRPTDDTAFNPEPFSMLYQRSLFQSMRTRLNHSFDLLQHRLPTLSENLQLLGTEVLNRRKVLNDYFYRITRLPIEAQRIRCHGDYHLGQVLFTGKDFAIIDFEGEPDRPISERRIKSSPLRDVAGMLRSFHYVARAALRTEASSLVHHSATDIPLEEWLNSWSQWSSTAFLQSYLEGMSGSKLLPQSAAQLEQLLNMFILEKSLYELSYELNNRPDWVDIPLEGIASILHNSLI